MFNHSVLRIGKDKMKTWLTAISTALTLTAMLISPRANADLLGTVTERAGSQLDACAAAKNEAARRAEFARQAEKVGKRGDFEVSVQGCQCEKVTYGNVESGDWKCAADWALRGRHD